MEIIEGNKLIAEFVGHVHANGLIERPQTFSLYHDSWKWLMPVVEKIEQQSYDKEQFSVKIQDSCCTVYNYRMGRENIQCSRESNSKITATWQAVVAFIQWHNQQTALPQ
ncbi:hypothetical protein [Dyadobacter sandarakinus]|uniref:Uncharacterized protein n=1 Tax=Dyadobacter sandarakinus TaxID=2747268 RepID=A0ABX7I1K7_9BACT|nr:hypothetical protein [Dyadobacter sandarakinus]QRQ99752.1 hypothetical protein HWI92_01870 [Dyadobacter sandarakinus]